MILYSYVWVFVTSSIFVCLPLVPASLDLHIIAKYNMTL